MSFSRAQDLPFYCEETESEVYWIYAGKTLQDTDYVWEERRKGTRVFYKCKGSGAKQWRLPAKGTAEKKTSKGKERRGVNTDDLLAYNGGVEPKEMSQRLSNVKRNFFSGILKCKDEEEHDTNSIGPSYQSLLIPETARRTTSSSHHKNHRRRRPPTRLQSTASHLSSRFAADEEANFLDILAEQEANDSDEEAAFLELLSNSTCSPSPLRTTLNSTRTFSRQESEPTGSPRVCIVRAPHQPVKETIRAFE
eukprot:TRINITY_DN2174_c0_g7_i1.p1 TRINITY_DN2174_c0_g7~~TRINITY_DN2174_c0_g7_i1.p1  ORF type:complete len:251 (+),score=46.53 TRINITY_DN2174_c0_g7_i1:64-816(+)